MRTEARAVIAPLPWLLTLALGAAPAVGQREAGSGATPAPTAASAPAAKAPKIAIVGASVSAGFIDRVTDGSTDNSTVPLQKVLEGWLGPIGAEVESTANIMMFLRAEALGEQQIDRAVRAEPAIAFAIDFLFWYGYGRAADLDQRMQRLEAGLRQLDRLQCPMIVGDLPDMRGADRRMLSPAQIPSEPELERLNERIRKWAAERPRVRLFPLGPLVARMKREGIEVATADGTWTAPPRSLLQSDDLHANRVGMAFLGVQLQPLVRAAWPADLPELPQWTFEQFVAAADAGVDLEDLRHRAQKAGKKAGYEAGEKGGSEAGEKAGEKAGGGKAGGDGVRGPGKR